MISYYKTLDGALTQIEAYEDGCWVNAIAPNAEEIQILKERFKVEPEYILDSLDEEESSRIEHEDGHTFIIFDVPCAEKENDNIIYNATPLGVIVTHHSVITIAKTDNPVLMDFTHGVVKNVRTDYKTHFVLTLFSRMATRFLQYLRQIDRYSSNLETKLRKSMKNKELVQLLDLQKSLVYFQTALKSNEMTVKKLLRYKYIKLYEEDEDLIEDVLIDIQQAIEMCSISTTILANTMDAFSSVISNNLNQVMKVLTSITILMAIPTMVFSFFGMNIGATSGALPLADNMIFVSVFTAVVTVVAGIILYKKDMF